MIIQSIKNVFLFLFYFSMTVKIFFKNIFLLFYYYFPIRIFLQKNGYKKIKLYKFSSWHHGYAYFIVEKNKKQFFVKVDTKLFLLHNDILFYKLATSDLNVFLVEIENSFFKNNFQIVIYQFLHNSKELTIDYLIQNRYLINDIILILNKLSNLEIVHRDIKLDNFFVIDNKIKIIDFTFTNSVNKSLGFKELDLSIKNYRILESLGAGLKPQAFIWNDFYALKMILLQIENERNIDFSKYLKKIDTYKHISYSVEASTRYLKIKKLTNKIKLFLKN